MSRPSLGYRSALVLKSDPPYPPRGDFLVSKAGDGQQAVPGQESGTQLPGALQMIFNIASNHQTAVIDDLAISGGEQIFLCLTDQHLGRYVHAFVNSPDHVQAQWSLARKHFIHTVERPDEGHQVFYPQA